MSGVLKKLFGEGPGIKNVVTLFHNPQSSTSTRVYTYLKQAHAQAASHATEDQASDHTAQTQQTKGEFELEVTEAEPTADQLRSILEFSGAPSAGQVVEGATSVSDAVGKLSKFQRPVVVDWNNGKVVVGDNESEILKLIKGRQS